MTGTDRTPRPTAVIYARSASRRPADGSAVPRQLANCRRLARFVGATVVLEACDIGVAGTREDRHGLKKVFAFVQRNTVDYVISDDMTRLARSADVWLRVSGRLTGMGARLLYADQMVTSCRGSNESEEGPP